MPIINACSPGPIRPPVSPALNNSVLAESESLCRQFADERQTITASAAMRFLEIAENCDAKQLAKALVDIARKICHIRMSDVKNFLATDEDIMLLRQLVNKLDASQKETIEQEIRGVDDENIAGNISNHEKMRVLIRFHQGLYDFAIRKANTSYWPDFSEGLFR